MTCNRLSLSAAAAVLLLSCSGGPSSGDRSRGIGVYPGDPAAYTGPAMAADPAAYRNVALRRAAYHSSAYDYNLTGHLVTDGIVGTEAPYFIALETNAGPAAKKDRERIMDDNTTPVSFPGGSGAFLTLTLHNGTVPADKILFRGTLNCDPDAGGYDIFVEAADAEGEWTLLKEFHGRDLPGTPRMMRRPGGAGGGSQNVTVAAGLNNAALTQEMQERLRQMQRVRSFEYEAALPAGRTFTAFRIRLDAPCVETWNMQEVDFFADGAEISPLPSRNFRSAWMSEGNENEWLYVDLGARAEFDRVVLRWIDKPAGGVLETSDDAAVWKKVADLPGGPAATDELSGLKGSGRYVRLSGLSGARNGRIILSEMEVWGRGGLVPAAAPQPAPEGNRLYLSGGNWRLARASEVTEEGGRIAAEGFAADDWIVATVPGTVASSYYNVGAIPDIRYDDDQLQISESFFTSDFWYRDTFELPADFAGKDLTLHFDGINWKADVWFNGRPLGRIDGAFTRGAFDITALATAGTNVLAVKIWRNENPGIIKEQDRLHTDVNGGVLGGDNPTMHSTIGWDWIPTVRGRNIGIWNDVWIGAYDGGVSIDDVYVETDLPLPSTDYADLRPTVTLTNHAASEKTAAIRLSYGGLDIRGDVTLAAGETRDVELAAARLDRPRLWWPNGYGEQYLYDVETTVSVDGRVSDTKRFRSGVREMAYTTDGGVLDIWINGRRLIGNGGNWGYPEINLNYRAREYDIAVAYHADMNCTMIRNWVGQTGDEEFYEACDRHGIMVWQDFWLANPVDGPNPYDEAMFMANAEDFVRKIRRHPSLALYVGRNEGNPPETIDRALDRLVARLHPGMYYIPHSSAGMVSGGGPYRALAVNEYFNAERGRDRLHSERGMPNVMTYESMTRMLRPEHQWPQTSVWGMHDYTLENAQSCATFNAMIETAFGEPEDLRQFTQRAQWINYNGYRAMFESRSWNRKGLQLWMSHSCWPSMVWQTYDYYFEPTAAYFAVKKASAPIRIQWNPVSGNVEVVNNNASDQSGLRAEAAVVDCGGKVLFETSAELDSREDTTVPVFPLSPEDVDGLTDTYFIKLKLFRGGELLADNFYWEGREDGNWRQLLDLPQVRVSLDTRFTLADGRWTAVATVKNPSDVPALMIRLRLHGKSTGESILPVFYGDNWFSLLPGEEKTVEITFADFDTRGEKPALSLEGFNVRSL